MIRVLMVTPVRLMSDLIQKICAEQPDLHVVGCAATKQDGLDKREACDVLLVSAALPDNGALDLIHACARQPGSPAVVIIGAPNAQPLLLRYLEAGAAGCIRDQDSLDELVRAIHMAAARQIALTQDMFDVVLKRVMALAQECAKPVGESPEDKNLTRREREILGLIARGYRNREIAQHLTIELGTTKNHVHNILDKLNVKSRQDAAVYYDLGFV